MAPSLPLQRRRRAVLIVMAVTLALALMPHPKSPKGLDVEEQQQHYLAMAQEAHHGHFPFHFRQSELARQEAEAALEAKVIEAENASVSLTLLGCIAFVMATFYLVNWPDKDIQHISLEVINSTISVFGALLLFHSFEEILEHFFLPELSMWGKVVASMTQMVLWFVLLQLVLAYYSGALGQNEAVLLRSNSRSVAEACGSPRTQTKLMTVSERHLNVVKLNTEACGILLGHVTGFAAKNACSILQQAVPRSFFWVAWTPLMSLLIICVVYRATDYFRYKKTMADGEEDEFEHLWRERAAETEDEVIALAVSFVIVQMLRFGVSGHLPNGHGEDPEEYSLHSNWSCALLLVVGLVPGVADVVRVLLKRSTSPLISSAKQFMRSFSRIEGDEEEPRTRNWCEGISSMCFAWCIHFAVEWWMTSHTHLPGSMKAVCSALLVTALAFVLIFGLDKVADMHFDDEEVDRALRGMISALGLLVGISWELCFHASLDGLAEHRYFADLPPTLGRIVLAVCLAVMVLPAWKWYILPMLHQHQHGHGHSSHPSPALEDDCSETRKPRLIGRLGSGIFDDKKGKLERRFSSFSRSGSVSLLEA